MLKLYATVIIASVIYGSSFYMLADSGFSETTPVDENWGALEEEEHDYTLPNDVDLTIDDLDDEQLELLDSYQTEVSEILDTISTNVIDIGNAFEEAATNYDDKAFKDTLVKSLETIDAAVEQFYEIDEVPLIIAEHHETLFEGMDYVTLFIDYFHEGITNFDSDTLDLAFDSINEASIIFEDVSIQIAEDLGEEVIYN